MTTRLWLLNLVMLALIAAGVWKIRSNWLVEHARERAFLNQPSKAAPIVASLIPPAQPPVTAAQYLEVASQLLLSKDRNPNVVVEVEAPKVQPPYPRFYGAMDFGDGLRVVLANKGAPQKSYQLGDTIGEFKILAVSRAGIDFEWDGKKVFAAMSQMRDTTPVVQETATQAAAAAPPKQTATTVIGGDASKPGVEIANDTKGCQPGDQSPAGTVQDGYRKVVSQTPFGSACRWERVK